MRLVPFSMGVGGAGIESGKETGEDWLDDSGWVGARGGTGAGCWLPVDWQSQESKGASANALASAVVSVSACAR